MSIFVSGSKVILDDFKGDALSTTPPADHLLMHTELSFSSQMDDSVPALQEKLALPPFEVQTMSPSTPADTEPQNDAHDSMEHAAPQA
eukprot:scaffold500550_cov14-Prasinocladus_malaysianus.AAC.1